MVTFHSLEGKGCHHSCHFLLNCVEPPGQPARVGGGPACVVQGHKGPRTFCPAGKRRHKVCCIAAGPAPAGSLLSHPDHHSGRLLTTTGWRARGCRNYDVIIAAGMRLPLDGKFVESTACNMTVSILRSFLI